MKLTREQVQEIAKLGRLELKEEEIKKFQGELSSILDYVDELQKVDVTHVGPTNQVTDLENITRHDMITEKDRREEMLDSAPEVEANQVKVPKVL